MSAPTTPVTLGPRPPAIAVLVEERYRHQTQPAGLARALSERGCAVRVFTDFPPDISSFSERLHEFDLVVLRGRSDELLTAVERAMVWDIPVIDTPHAVRSVRDKALQSYRMGVRGVPTPDTWVGSVRELSTAIPTYLYPLVCKPQFGDNSRGIVLVHDAEEFSQLDWPEPQAVVQRYVPSDGVDLKLYVIGEQVAAVRKPSPVKLDAEPRHESRSNLGPRTVTAEMRHIVQQCRSAFGLSFFGIDCIEGPAGLQVIEVNDFPNYTDVPRADEQLARFALSKLRVPS